MAHKCGMLMLTTFLSFVTFSMAQLPPASPPTTMAPTPTTMAPTPTTTMAAPSPSVPPPAMSPPPMMSPPPPMSSPPPPMAPTPMSSPPPPMTPMAPTPMMSPPPPMAPTPPVTTPGNGAFVHGSSMAMVALFGGMASQPAMNNARPPTVQIRGQPVNQKSGCCSS